MASRASTRLTLRRCALAGILGSRDELSGRHAESGRQGQNAREREVVLATLDAADVVAVHAGAVGERLLRQAQGRSVTPNRGAKRGMGIRERGHAPHAAYLTRQALPTMTVIWSVLDPKEAVMDDRRHPQPPRCFAVPGRGTRARSSSSPTVRSAEL